MLKQQLLHIASYRSILNVIKIENSIALFCGGIYKELNSKIRL